MLPGGDVIKLLQGQFFHDTILNDIGTVLKWNRTWGKNYVSHMFGHMDVG